MKDGPTMAVPGTNTRENPDHPQNTRPVIKEGFYFHEKPRSRIPQFLARPSERYLVLRLSDAGEIRNRDEPLHVLEIYDEEQHWNNMKCYKPIKKGGKEWFKDQILIEDLYYIHTHDVDPLRHRKDNSLYFQCVLYFRAERQTDKMRKLELWFKRDDKDKRTVWVNNIHNSRSDIQNKYKRGEIPISVAKYYKTRELFPEVEYYGFTLESDNQNLKPQDQEKTSSQIRNRNQLVDHNHYHLTFDEKTVDNHGKYRYSIDFIDPKTAECKYSIQSTDYDADGDFDRPITSRYRQKSKPPVLNEYAFRLQLNKCPYVLTIKFLSEDQKILFQRTLGGLKDRNRRKKLEKEDMRGRCHTGPPPTTKRNPPRSSNPSEHDSQYIGNVESRRNRTTSGPPIGDRPMKTPMGRTSPPEKIEMTPLDKRKSKSVPTIPGEGDVSSLPLAKMTTVPEDPSLIQQSSSNYRNPSQLRNPSGLNPARVIPSSSQSTSIYKNFSQLGLRSENPSTRRDFSSGTGDNPRMDLSASDPSGDPSALVHKQQDKEVQSHVSKT